MCHRYRYHVFAICAMLGTVGTACADLVAITCGGHAASCRIATGVSVPNALGHADLINDLLGDTSTPPNRLLADVEQADCGTGGAGRVAETLTLPPGPGSANLFLWALGGCGLWQAGRSARKLQLGALPEWYHAGGPAQIGYATPLDVEFSRAAMPLCCFDVPAEIGNEASGRWGLGCEPAYHLSARHFLLAAAPRGPPLHS